MQTQILTQLEHANISRALLLRAQERGTVILGSQLGTLIGHAIRPKSLKEIGGLRAVTDTDLRGTVRPLASSLDSADVTFEIIETGSGKSAAIDGVPGVRPVIGRELWRCFSNPNVACQLAVDQDAATQILPPHMELPAGWVALPKPTSEDYRKLARQFADSQPDAEVRSSLLAALEPVDFYNGWIGGLRRLRVGRADLLKDWETLRTEYVISKLNEGLASCGLDEAKAAEIVVLARPIQAVRQPPLPPSSAQQPPHMPSASTLSIDKAGSTGPLDLRRLLHEAIDLMSYTDLRDLRIPVGVLQDAIQRLRR